MKTLIVIALLLAAAFCGEATEYRYDTGIAENWANVYTAYGIAAEFDQGLFYPLNPHNPWITSVRFYVRTTTLAPFKWYLYDAATSGGPPGALAAAGSDVAQPGQRWVNCTTGGVRTTRLFYVAFEFYEEATEPWLGNDIHGTSQYNYKYYWKYDKSGPWRPNETRPANYMIRAYGDDVAVGATSLGRVKAVYR